MKKDQIKKNIYHRVRIRPIAKRTSGNISTDGPDDEWIIEGVNDEGVLIKNLRTDHVTTLGFDHIHSYLSDPNRNQGTLKYGFLVLNVQLCIHGRQVLCEPSERPGWPSVNKDLSLSEALDWSSLTPSIRSYLVQNGIVRVSDAIRIDFDNMLRQKNIGQAGAQRLARDLVAKGVLPVSGYIKRYL